MSTKADWLRDCLQNVEQAPYPYQSRIHPLNSFKDYPFKCYVKRDDELGFGISGSKIRKYRTLIPFICKSSFEEVVVIGSAHSNHVISFCQLLIEKGIRVTLFLRGDVERIKQGNALLTALFIPSSSIHWISKADWVNVNQLAQAYADRQPHSVLVVPEGGALFEALPGALTLALDVWRHLEDGVSFEHIFIEAGTGFMAMALLLGLFWLQIPLHVHIVLLAEDQAAFLKRLQWMRTDFEKLLQTSIDFPANFSLYLPQVSGKFGQIKQNVLEEMSFLAKKEGFLTDPIYSAKLFCEVRYLLRQKMILGNCLIHHSGGALTLLGFEKHLQELIKAQ